MSMKGDPLGDPNRQDAPSTATLGTLLRHLIELLDGDVEASYRALGLNYRARYTPIVRALARTGPASIRALATASGLTHSAVSQTVAVMVRDGLVVSRPGADGRERLIEPTDALRRMTPQLETQWAATNQAAASLSQEVGVQLEEMLARAIGALERKPFRRRIAEAQAGQEHTDRESG